jgi:bacteriocin-like protein
MSNQEPTQKDNLPDFTNEDELTKDQLEQVSGGSPNNSKGGHKKPPVNDFLKITLQEVFIS